MGGICSSREKEKEKKTRQRQNIRGGLPRASVLLDSSVQGGWVVGCVYLAATHTFPIFSLLGLFFGAASPRGGGTLVVGGYGGIERRQALACSDANPMTGYPLRDVCLIYRFALLELCRCMHAWHRRDRPSLKRIRKVGRTLILRRLVAYATRPQCSIARPSASVYKPPSAAPIRLQTCFGRAIPTNHVPLLSSRPRTVMRTT